MANMTQYPKKCPKNIFIRPTFTWSYARSNTIIIDAPESKSQSYSLGDCSTF